MGWLPCARVALLAALATPCGALSSRAHAQALDPLNRLHAGVSLVPGPAPLGIVGGFDSRLTRLFYVDVGGFASPGALDPSLLPAEHNSADALLLRHGIQLSPGARVPHPQPAAFSFDVILRGGMAAIWLADLDRDVSQGLSIYANEVAGLAGADLLVQRGRAGMRLTWRQLFYAPFLEDQHSDVVTTVPLFGLEGQVQFGGAPVR